jgi:Nif-specific regulatory protein/two-component system response regulator AtoC
MPKPPVPQLTPITFLQTFAAQSLRAAKRLGCAQCEDDLSHVEHIGLTPGTCFEEAVRRQLGLEGPIDVDQYADLILTIKNQIGGSDMGISPRAVHQKLRRHGIDPRRFRPPPAGSTAA